YAVFARATDTNNGVAQSAMTGFTVNPTNPFPTVSITYPSNGAAFYPGADITITATASDTTPGYVTNVEFFVDGVSLGSDPTVPYSITKCCWPSGAFALTDKAPDNLGA